MPQSLEEAGYRFVTLPRLGKLKRFRMHWKNGNLENYPICCILRFSLEMALQDGKTSTIKEVEAKHRGIAKGGQVPCDVFHHKKDAVMNPKDVEKKDFQNLQFIVRAGELKASGYSEKEIADALGISTTSVRAMLRLDKEVKVLSGRSDVQ